MFAFGVLLLILFRFPFWNQENIVYAAGNRVVVDSYSIEKGDFTPGSTATLAFQLKNIGGAASAKNIFIQMSSTTGITPVYGESNQKYVEKIVSNGMVKVFFKVDIPTAIETEKADILLRIEYETAKGEDRENQVTVAIPVNNNGELEINNVSIPENAKAGIKALISVSYANGSDITLRDSQIHIKGNVKEDGSSIEIGNIESGMSKYKDLYVTFQDPGEQKIELTFSYNDAEGKKITKEICEEMVTVIANTQIEKDFNSDRQVKKEDTLHKNIVKGMILLAIGMVCLGIVKSWRKQ